MAFRVRDPTLKVLGCRPGYIEIMWDNSGRIVTVTAQGFDDFRVYNSGRVVTATAQGFDDFRVYRVR